MRERRKWTAEEDAILRREASVQSKSTEASRNQHSHPKVQDGQLKQWSVVAARLEGRTNKDCRKRWAKLDQNVKKGAWSAAEDEKLHAAVQQLGCKWTEVAKLVDTRHAEQCAKRWQNSLDPNLDHSKWDDDNEKLLNCVQQLGRNWTAIRMKCFPNRTTTDLKNRYELLIRKQRRAVEAATTIFGNPLTICNPNIQTKSDNRRDIFQNANENYENDIGMEDEEDDLDGEVEEDEEEEAREESQIEEFSFPTQNSYSPAVNSFIPTFENESCPLPHTTLDLADIESQFLELGDYVSNTCSPMDFSSSINCHIHSPPSTSEDDLKEWDSNHIQFTSLSPVAAISTNNTSPSSQIKSIPSDNSHPRPQMDMSSELFGFGSHEIFPPSTTDSNFWMNVDSEPMPASPSQTTLVLENVDSLTLNSIMQLLIASNTKMTMKR
ncbi:hypothetical protein VTL71DRAFT_1918 [Oculimacula yallundae]|uniref:Uncharacterized protein n=1 Tax=Oculimacula yallundae TaxID=86028 RepID=A0ABR4CEH2_9HELO